MKTHWENIYDTKQLHEVSWFQPMPTTSLALIEMLGLAADAAIIDIGGGDSYLADNLLTHGFEDLSVLDISKRALERAAARIGDAAEKIDWIEADIATFEPTRQYSLWHDRAAFHFLTEEEALAHYVKTASAHIKSGGYLIIATFGEDGPLKCSGLHIQQYSEQSLAARFVQSFELVKTLKDTHKTPSGTEQSFVFVVMKRK